MATKCGNQSTTHPDKVCVRNAGHLGCHRDTVRMKTFGTFVWGDNEGRPARG